MSNRWPVGVSWWRGTEREGKRVFGGIGASWEGGKRGKVEEHKTLVYSTHSQCRQRSGHER